MKTTRPDNLPFNSTEHRHFPLLRQELLWHSVLTPFLKVSLSEIFKGARLDSGLKISKEQDTIIRMDTSTKIVYKSENVKISDTFHSLIHPFPSIRLISLTHSVITSLKFYCSKHTHHHISMNLNILIVPRNAVFLLME